MTVRLRCCIQVDRCWVEKAFQDPKRWNFKHVWSTCALILVEFTIWIVLVCFREAQFCSVSVGRSLFNTIICSFWCHEDQLADGELRLKTDTQLRQLGLRDNLLLMVKHANTPLPLFHQHLVPCCHNYEVK